MTKEDFLTQEICTRYKSVMAFSKNINIPYTTIKGMLSRGVDGASVQTVIKVCQSLGVSVEYLMNEEFNKKSPSVLEEQVQPDVALVKGLTDALIKAGFIEEGQDLSDSDLEFCKALFLLIRSHYDKE